MQRLARIALVVAAAMPAAAATAAAGGGVAGTWRGPLTELDELHYHPQARLAVNAAGVTAAFSGLTGAAHDAPTATTTCSLVFRFKLETATWRYYRQVGRPRVTSAGYVQNSPCIAPPNDVVLRVRLVAAGAKLQAEFAQGGQFLHDLDAEFVAGSRAYLRR